MKKWAIVKQNDGIYATDAKTGKVRVIRCENCGKENWGTFKSTPRCGWCETEYYYFFGKVEKVQK